jgi:hypothetical protein
MKPSPKKKLTIEDPLNYLLDIHDPVKAQRLNFVMDTESSHVQNFSGGEYAFTHIIMEDQFEDCESTPIDPKEESEKSIPIQIEITKGFNTVFHGFDDHLLIQEEPSASISSKEAGLARLQYYPAL